MVDVSGASAEAEQALVCDQAAARLDPSGFDPSRVWHHALSDLPVANSRIVVLYHDGSGAYLAFWTGEQLFDADGDAVGGVIAWPDEWAGEWAYAPPGLKLWCERRQDDPMTFPASAMSARSGETEGLAPQDASAVGKAETPAPNQDPSHV